MPPTSTNAPACMDTAGIHFFCTMTGCQAQRTESTSIFFFALQREQRMLNSNISWYFVNNLAFVFWCWFCFPQEFPKEYKQEVISAFNKWLFSGFHCVLLFYVSLCTFSSPVWVCVCVQPYFSRIPCCIKLPRVCCCLYFQQKESEK